MTGATRVRAVAVAAGVLAADAAVAYGSGEGGGSPSIFAGDLGNVIWSLVTFGAVVYVLGKFAWPPVLKALQKREAFIRDSLAAAKRDREEAEARLAEFEERLQAARDEAAGIVDQGRKGGETLKREIERDARREAEAIIGRATREIGLARDSAVKELCDLTATLATEVASRIIRKEIDAKEHERLIAESIEELARHESVGRN
jgi:F-type H+-transporting ATPase subunit b